MNRRNPQNPVLKATLLLTSTLSGMVTGVLLSALPSMLIALIASMAGYAVDTIGREMVLVMSTIVYGISGLVGYLAPILTWLLFSRAVLGIAVGGVIKSVTALITDYYAGRVLGQVLGFQAAFMGFAGKAWLALGGLLADVGWRVPFLAYVLAYMPLPPILLALYEPLWA